jgi:hypothetical protein
MSTNDLKDLTNRELNADIAHARNARDAYAAGKEPQEVLQRLSSLLTEQARRRDERIAARAAR